MKYIDSKSPPKKGFFEYRPQTLQNYGRIFSSKEIGKYSAKIKTICEQIYNAKEDRVSEGVILIYSQYIDGGLIPMVLALEEMGLTRYGNTASLFKTPPTTQVDVRTMRPKPTTTSSSASKTKTDFIPAKYILITGDTRLSPDKEMELKAVTNSNNKDGYRIKVVLISKAGSEGLDFKFLRQVHILEPWYNMNRIEQIIGRAVRNYSHKDLPFEKRNVQIYLYATLLEKEKEKEEAADLYVYRVAEYKAIQMGKISRLLKETAVDCILNHDQTNFTEEKMAEINEQGVLQILSNGQNIQDFKVGDKPFTSACDYMETCDFKCYPDEDTGERDIREDSYGESFLLIHSEKIAKKIRMLFKERFFYTKKNLIQRINVPKPYPLAEIYATLTQMIEDSTEIIVDKYNRNGHLVNIGEYYLFQPNELNQPSLTTFERSAPVDYKHTMVEFTMDPSILSFKNEEDDGDTNLNEKGASEMGTSEKGVSFIEKCKQNLETATTFFHSNDNVPRGDFDWYKHCGVTMRKMNKVYKMISVSEEDLHTYLIEHMVDVMQYKEKWDVLNYLYAIERIEIGSIEESIKQYLESQMIQTKRFKGIVLFSNKGENMLILKGKEWVEAEPEDKLDIAKKVIENWDTIMQTKQFDQWIGCIHYDNKNTFLVFKIKQMVDDVGTIDVKNTGARCDEASKRKKVNILNTIYQRTDTKKWFIEETVTESNKKEGFVTTKGMVQAELCSLIEFSFRHYNKDKRICFLTYEQAKTLEKFWQYIGKKK